MTSRFDPNPPSRWQALAEGIAVMIIWSASFVLVKLALPTTGALTIAGLRYFLAFLAMLPFLWRSPNRRRPDSRGTWARLAIIGLAAFVFGNGVMFWALKFIPATTGSLLFGLSPLIILGGSAVWLREYPTGWQIAGTGLALAGSALFFSPGLRAGEMRGVILALFAQASFAVFGLMSRDMARTRRTDTLTLTTVPLGVGGGVALAAGVLLEGIPRPSAEAWLAIVTLALVNSALAYVIYYHALQTLTALEMNVLLNLGPLVTAAIASAMLGEVVLPLQVVGMVAVVAGVGIVQAFRRGRGIAVAE